MGDLSMHTSVDNIKTVENQVVVIQTWINWQKKRWSSGRHLWTCWL